MCHYFSDKKMATLKLQINNRVKRQITIQQEQARQIQPTLKQKKVKFLKFLNNKKMEIMAMLT